MKGVRRSVYKDGRWACLRAGREGGSLETEVMGGE